MEFSLDHLWLLSPRDADADFKLLTAIGRERTKFGNIRALTSLCPLMFSAQFPIVVVCLGDCILNRTVLSGELRKTFYSNGSRATIKFALTLAFWVDKFSTSRLPNKNVFCYWVMFSSVENILVHLIGTYLHATVGKSLKKKMSMVQNEALTSSRVAFTCCLVISSRHRNIIKTVQLFA